MARTVKDANLSSREGRRKLETRGAAHWREIGGSGHHLGFRKLANKDGTWWLRAYVGKQAYEVERLGTADDYSDADGLTILTYKQALNKARELFAKRTRAAHGIADDLTVGKAVDHYIEMRDARESKRRGRQVRSDAHRLARHVTGREQRGNLPAIAAAPLAAVRLDRLEDNHLTGWRKHLPTGMTAAAKQRITNDLRAALNDAYRSHRKQLDASVETAIRHGLKKPAHDDDDEPVARENQILSDDQVRRILRAAKEIDEEVKWDGDLHRIVVLLAATGARFSQLIRMRVADALLDEQRLMIPCSRKGQGKTGSARVPIGDDVVAILRPAMSGKPKSALLLDRWRHRNIGGKWERSERGPWQSAAELIRVWPDIIARAKLPDAIPYSLRHSSIVRGIKAGLPIRLVAALHDTSTIMIERHYSKWITTGLDDLAATAVTTLVAKDRGAKVVALRR